MVPISAAFSLEAATLTVVQPALVGGAVVALPGRLELGPGSATGSLDRVVT